MNTTFKDGFDKNTHAEELNWELKPWEQVNDIQHPAYKYGELLNDTLPDYTFEVNQYEVFFFQDTEDYVEVIKISTKDPISEADLQTLREQLPNLSDLLDDASALSAIKVVHHLEELDDESYIELIIITYIEF